MEKNFIQSSNYFVAETMNDEPEVQIDNYIDEEDGGFKISASIDLGNLIVIYTKTMLKSILSNSKMKTKCPDFEISEIDLINKKINHYKVKLSKSVDLNEEDYNRLQNRKELAEEQGGQA